MRQNLTFFSARVSAARGDVLDLAVTHNLVDKAGAWGTATTASVLGQGRENVRTFLKSNPAVFAELDALLRDKLGIGGGSPVPVVKRRRCMNRLPA